MTRREIFEFVARHTMAVEASFSSAGGGRVQAAAIGIVMNEDLEIFFDTQGTSRKAQNLRKHPAIALVIGWEEADGRTVQVEGTADEPTGTELARFKELYFARFPGGRERERWPDIAYFRVKPTWIRFSDFNAAPDPRIIELDAAALGPDHA